MRIAVLIGCVLFLLAASLTAIVTAGMSRLSAPTPVSARPYAADENSGAAPTTAPAIEIVAVHIGEVPAPSADVPALSIPLPVKSATLSGPGLLLVDPADPALYDRDAFDRGGRGFRYSTSRAPYITNWTEPDAAVEWTVTVPQAGTYGITLDYSCPYGGGGRFVVSVDGRDLLPGEVFPTRPSRSSRYSSSSSTVELGSVRLPAGVFSFTIRSTEPQRFGLMNLRDARLYRVE